MASKVPMMHRDMAARLNLPIEWDGGIKIKNGSWTPPMDYPESYAYLLKLTRGVGGCRLAPLSHVR